MKFSEAISMLEQGKKIRRKTWRPDAYYIFIHDCILDENNLPVLMAVDTSLKADWEEHIDTKHRVKRWLYAYRNKHIRGHQEWQVGTKFFDDRGPRHVMDGSDEYIKLPWTEMEFEE